MALVPLLDTLVEVGAIRAYTPYLGINAIVVTGDDGARQFLASWPAVAEVHPYDPAGALARVLAEADLTSPAAGTAHIQGAVTGPGGVTPLVGIEATAYRFNNVIWVDVGTATTAADGSYDIGALPAGQYKVGFADPDGNYMPEFYDDKADLYSGTPFMLAEGETKTSINASLALAGRVTGTLTDGANGSPVANFIAYAWRLAGSVWELATYASSGSDGKYLIGGLPAGSYRVQFRDVYQPPTAKPRYTEEWYFNAPTRELANDIAVTAGQTQTGIDAALNGSGTVMGTVTGPDGLTPAAGIQVDLYQYNAFYASWQWVNDALTAADGKYSIVALAGAYCVGFSDPLVPPYFTPEYYNDKSDIGSGNDVVVANKGTATVNASLALLALPPAPALTLTRNGTDADLAWGAIEADTAGKSVTIQRYEVWYSAAAYFAISDAGATRVDVECAAPGVDCAAPSFTDTGALAAPGGRFYLLAALTDRGGYSPASNKTAKFTFALAPGAQ
jgi:hypothetical protein